MIPQIWAEETYQNFLDYLKSISEKKYKEFQNKLCFTKYEMLGIRIPELRKIASKIYKTNYKNFINLNKNKYYEEIMIEGFVIANIQEENLFDEYFLKHIEKIDDWSLCDSFCNSLKQVSKNKEKYFHLASNLSLKEEEFISRVGITIILFHFVEEKYLEDIFSLLNNIQSDKYYINMAEAWLICELYIKYKERTLKFLQNNKVNDFTQNKAISKIKDSYRVTKEEKDYLNTLKRK